MSLKLIPLIENQFGLVIVTVIVVVLVPPTTTVDGLNDFAIVSGNPCANRDGLHASSRRMAASRSSGVAFPASRRASIDSTPFRLVKAIEWRLEISYTYYTCVEQSPNLQRALGASSTG